LGLDGLTPCAQKILRIYFPDLDLSKINIKKRIPIYIKLPPGKVLGYKTPFNLNKVNIRKSEYNQESIYGLSLIAHELQHVSQAREEGSGRWLMHYIGDNIRNGYWWNKYEVDARVKQETVSRTLRQIYGRKNPCP